MSCKTIAGGKKKQTQKRGNKKSRKTMRGGFWPFTSEKSKSETENPAPKGFFASLFGTRTPVPKSPEQNAQEQNAPIKKEVNLPPEEKVVEEKPSEPVQKGGKKKGKKSRGQKK